MTAAPAIPLTLDHVRAVAAWLAHGPGTIRQVATRADMHLIDLHPRSLDLIGVGALATIGQSESDGPILVLQLIDVATPSAADLVQRKLNSLDPADQVSIAAGILARHSRRGGHLQRFTRAQDEILLTGSATEGGDVPLAPKAFALE